MKLRDFLDTIKSKEPIVVCCQMDDTVDSIKELYIVNDPRDYKPIGDTYICYDTIEAMGTEEAGYHVDMITVSTFNEITQQGETIRHPCLCVCVLHPIADEFSCIDNDFVEFREKIDQDNEGYIQIRKNAVDAIQELGDNTLISLRNGHNHSVQVPYERCCEVLI